MSTPPIVVQRLQDANLALTRQQEIISDISFTAGSYWSRISEEVRELIMEHLDGSRGLHAKFIEWAVEFDTWWEALAEDDPDRENYIGKVDDFAHEKINVLIAELRLD